MQIPNLQIFLFGKLALCQQGHLVAPIENSKAAELLCYLLLHRERPHPREALATLLWKSHPAAQSKKYLRQALWQLQTCLNSLPAGDEPPLLLAEGEWIQINPAAPLSLDVAVLETAYHQAQGVRGSQLSPQQAECLEKAAQLYRGDLLEGWYQDWCLFERDRLQNAYLLMVDKLVSYHAARQNYEKGLAWGEVILRHDRAHERAHYQMMRLYLQAGNRTAALRQFERCAAALWEELSVQPARKTQALVEQIRSGVDPDREATRPLAILQPEAAGMQNELLLRLSQMAFLLQEIHALVDGEQRL
jgi:DNA-binding SARP family transcriptional activator